jgi:hypothetical protein
VPFRLSLNASGMPACSHKVFKYDACAPVIGSSPESHSSGSFLVAQRSSNERLGSVRSGCTHSDLVEIAKRNGELRKNYDVLLSSALDKCSQTSIVLVASLVSSHSRCIGFLVAMN